MNDDPRYTRGGLNLTGLWVIMTEAASVLAQCGDQVTDPTQRHRISVARRELEGAAEMVSRVNRAEGYRGRSYDDVKEVIG